MSLTPKQELATFMARYTPAIAKQARAALEKLDALMPGATRLVYDNYNALVIGYGGSSKMSDIVCSIALYPRWITLFFLHGATLPDPQELLEGSGKQVRGIRLVDGAAMLDRPAIRALLREAIARAEFVPAAKATLEIRAVVAKQRPRRTRS